ncbi:MAG: hypothetical protein WBG18_05095 [Xanthobacteraceae bacterium]|jgi:hypothetical protein
MHKFKIGQTVYLERSLNVPGGAYVVTKRLPERSGEFEYQIKSVNEPHERVVRESQLETELQALVRPNRHPAAWRYSPR